MKKRENMSKDMVFSAFFSNFALVICNLECIPYPFAPLNLLRQRSISL